LVGSVDNLLTAIGYASNKAFAVESELLNILEGLGILNDKFDWTAIQRNVNSEGVYSMVDYIEKTMLFSDRPRPVLRHSKHPWYLSVAAEASPFSASFAKYIENWGTQSDESVIEDRDFYEFLKADDSASTFPAIAGSQNWNDDAVKISQIDGAGNGIPQDEGSLAGYGLHLTRQLKEMWSPYQDWYLPDEEYLRDELPAELGKIYAVRDEYNKGYFIPRYAVVPTRDNTDPFDCGFFYVLSHEMKGKHEPGSWGDWSENYVNDVQAAWDGVTKNVWESGSATLKDMLVFVGSSVFMKPLQGFRHYLSAQGSWFDRGGDDQLPEGGATPATVRNADITLAAMPFTPFLPPYAWPSVDFESGAADGVDDWADDGWYQGGGSSQEAYDHSYAVTTASRLALWYPMRYFDPLRPHRMRFTNMILTFLNRYSDIIHGAMEDFGTLFSTAQIERADVTTEAARFISDFAIGKDFKPPVNRSNSSGNSRSGKRTPSNLRPPKPAGPSKLAQTVDEAIDAGKMALAVAAEISKITGRNAGRMMVNQVKRVIENRGPSPFKDAVGIAKDWNTLFTELMSSEEIKEIIEQYQKGG
jgi:hypothetical protein